MSRRALIICYIMLVWFVISFVTNLIGPLMPIIIGDFHLSLGLAGFLPFSFFLAYGLVKGAYIGTEALSTVVMHDAKLIAYRESAILPTHAILSGLALGPLMVAGSFAGKRVVDRLPERVFVLIIDLTLLAAGVMFLAGFSHL